MRNARPKGLRASSSNKDEIGGGGSSPGTKQDAIFVALILLNKGRRFYCKIASHSGVFLFMYAIRNFVKTNHSLHYGQST